MKKQNK